MEKLIDDNFFGLVFFAVVKFASKNQVVSNLLILFKLIHLKEKITTAHLNSFKLI